MLMRMFDTSDYDRSLRRRRLMSLGLLAVGITGIVCYFLLIHHSDVLSDYARGFYLGAASGITIGSVILLHILPMGLFYQKNRPVKSRKAGRLPHTA